MSSPNDTMAYSVSRTQDIFPKDSPIDSKMTDVRADAGADLDIPFDPKALFQHTFTQDITHSSKNVQEGGSELQSQSQSPRPLTSASTTITTTTILQGRRHLRVPPTLVTLPAELVLIIASHLEYPDVLSLRRSHVGLSGVLSRHSTTHDRISWVLSRAYLGLPIPNSTRLSFKTDDLFLSNREVQRILAARLNHGECLSQNPDLIPARQLARTRLGQRKGNNLCFVGGAGPCPAVLAGRRQEKRNRRHWATMTTTRQKSSVLRRRNLLVFLCVVPLVAVAVEAGRYIRERAPGWGRWGNVSGCLLLLLAGWYLTQRH